MRDDFDPNWPHGHVTRNGLKYYGCLVGADGSFYGWIEGPLGHERAEHDKNGLYLNRHPNWPRKGYPYDLVNAPAPAPTPPDETATLKAQIAELEAKVAALTPEPASGVVWVNINRADSGKIWPGLPEISLLHADTCASSERIARVRVEWKEGQFDE